MTPRTLLGAFWGGVLGVITAAVIANVVTSRRDHANDRSWRADGAKGWTA